MTILLFSRQEEKREVVLVIGRVVWIILIILIAAAFCEGFTQGMLALVAILIGTAVWRVLT